MNITYGICTDGLNQERVNKIRDSIFKMYKNFPDYHYEIIEEIRNDGYITIQKNNITKRAKFDVVVYLHDYVSFDINWFGNILKFGGNFNILMTRIEDDTGLRFRDWTFWYQDLFELPIPSEKKTEIFAACQQYLIPYEWKEFSKFQYISGAFWVAKKSVMLEFPLNESLAWAQGEDVEWSKRVRSKYKFDICPEAIVRFIKPGKIRVFSEIDPKHREYLRTFL